MHHIYNFCKALKSQTRKLKLLQKIFNAETVGRELAWLFFNTKNINKKTGVMFAANNFHIY